jgi:hypothetical protein
MSVSIKVAIRCRPFTIDDKLGVHMVRVEAAELAKLYICAVSTACSRCAAQI